jgi:hypothetical protein
MEQALLPVAFLLSHRLRTQNGKETEERGRERREEDRPNQGHCPLWGSRPLPQAGSVLWTPGYGVQKMGR